MTLRHNVNLQPYHTFGLSASADTFVEVDPFYGEELDDLLRSEVLNGEHLILGEGSNVVFLHNYPGVVVRMVGSHIRFQTDGDSVLCMASAGTRMDELIRETLAYGAYGLENLSAIPGTVGAAPVQNVGAYGVEAGDRIESVSVYDFHQGCRRTLSNEDCRFGYRSSVFKQEPGRYLVLDVTFRLSRRFEPNLSYQALANFLSDSGTPHPSPAQLRSAIEQVRWSKLPRVEETGSAGSFFKNPVVSQADFARLSGRFPQLSGHKTGEGYKLSAAWLIDAAGWRGRCVGGAGVYERQPLVLVNLGRCTGDDLQQLCAAIQNDVFRQFGIWLQPEAIMVPASESVVRDEPNEVG